MVKTKLKLQITPFYIRGKRCPFGLRVTSDDKSISGSEFYRKSADAVASAQDLLEKFFASEEQATKTPPAPQQPAQ